MNTDIPTGEVDENSDTTEVVGLGQHCPCSVSDRDKPEDMIDLE